MTDNDPKLSDADAQKVLARAIELQARGADLLTVAQVREIAKELTIPESAVDQALAEFRATAVPANSPHAAAIPSSPNRRRRIGRVLVLSMAVLGGAVLLLLILTMAIRINP